MPIETFSIGPLETNCYLIHHEGHALAIDPGGDPAPVIDFIQKNKLTLHAIYLTHMHFDHLYGVADLYEATKAKIYYPQKDSFLLENESGKGGIWGFPKVKPFTGFALEEGMHNSAHHEALNFTVFVTPGHTPGSVSLYFPFFSSVFTGDLLFYRAVGRSDLPGGNHQVLIDSIQGQILTLPESTRVYPGHGPDTNVGSEKIHNPYCNNLSR